MKKVLCIIGKTIDKTSDYCKGVKQNFKKYGGNTGNFLFNYALEKYLTNDLCSVTYSNIQIFKYSNIIENINYINSNFDMILFSSANILNLGNKKQLESFTELINKIKIPTYFIGIGIQAINNEELEELKKAPFIKDFIKSVYNTGGHFACRGQITGEFIENLGFDNFEITGCPSMFIKDKNFKIEKQDLNEKNLKLLLNATEILKNPIINKLFIEYPDSIFIDQDRFYKILYDKNKLINKIRYSNTSIIKRFNQITLDLLKNNRIKLFSDIPVWFNYLQDNNFNFSFGGRIHGSIIAILNNIPACVYIKDLRIKELVDFYHIPYINKIDETFNIIDLYNKIDYSDFNKSYAQNFENYQNFFKKHDIPCILGENSKFDEKISKINFQNPDDYITF